MATNEMETPNAYELVSSDIFTEKCTITNDEITITYSDDVHPIFLCDGAVRKEEPEIRTLGGEEEHSTGPSISANGAYTFKFPGVSDAGCISYFNVLMCLAPRHCIEDYFTNAELFKIVTVVDNTDYSEYVYPNLRYPMTLFVDTYILTAIAKFKTEHGYSKLVDITKIKSTYAAKCAPIHSYTLTFKLDRDGTMIRASYTSNETVLKELVYLVAPDEY